jgi:dienelactone hydrolase
VARGDSAEIERRLRGEQIACDLRTQPGVGEGFADQGQPDRYDAIAARACWDAALARLRAELG